MDYTILYWIIVSRLAAQPFAPETWLTWGVHTIMCSKPGAQDALNQCRPTLNQHQLYVSLERNIYLDKILAKSKLLKANWLDMWVHGLNSMFYSLLFQWFPNFYSQNSKTRWYRLSLIKRSVWNKSIAHIYQTRWPQQLPEGCRSNIFLE